MLDGHINTGLYVVGKELKLDSFHNVFLCEGVLKGLVHPKFIFHPLTTRHFLNVASGDTV